MKTKAEDTIKKDTITDFHKIDSVVVKQNQQLNKQQSKLDDILKLIEEERPGIIIPKNNKEATKKE